LAHRSLAADEWPVSAWQREYESQDRLTAYAAFLTVICSRHAGTRTRNGDAADVKGRSGAQ